jgi:hypothetical protein
MEDAEQQLRGKPKVVPIDGWTLPPPPDWRLTEETKHLQRMAMGAVAPEDLTVRGKPRCVAKASVTGIRCGNEAVLGTTVCRFHGAATPTPDSPGEERSIGASAKRARIEAARQHLEFAAAAAVTAVMSIVEDEMARPQDRLKAAEIILDRTVGKTITLDKEEAADRDLDKEILAIAESVAPTGTEDSSPASPS